MKSLMRSLWVREEGSTILIGAVAFFMLMAIVGMGIDTFRQQALQSELQAATKLSAHAASKSLFSDCFDRFQYAPQQCLANSASALTLFQARFEQLFDRNFRLNGATAGFAYNVVDASPDAVTFRVIATAEMDTSIMSIWGINSIGARYESVVKKTLSGN